MLLAGAVALIMASGLFYLGGVKPSMPLVFFVAVALAGFGLFCMGWSLWDLVLYTRGS